MNPTNCSIDKALKDDNNVIFDSFFPTTPPPNIDMV